MPIWSLVSITNEEFRRCCGRAEHLWDIPAHRQAWERVAHGEGGFGQLYHSFCHFLETDAIYLLNDAVQTLPTGAPGPPAGLQTQQRLACKAVFRREQFYGVCALAWIGLHGLASLLRFLPNRTDAASTACM